MYGMSRLTEDEAVFLTSAMIYQDLVNVPTARRSSQKRGKINHQPAFTQGKKLLHHSREIPDDPSQHYYYDIYHKPPHESHLGVSGECCNDVKQHAIPSSSQDDLARAIQDVNMQKRSTSAFFINQDLYRSPDAFLSSLPLERRYLRSAHTSQSIPWNSSNQALRLSKEWTEKIESRANKRTSQVLGHRVDKLYMMNGNAVRLQPKYDVSDEELRHLKQLAKVREEVRGETRQSKHLQSNSKSTRTRKKTVPKTVPKKLPPIKKKDTKDNDDVASSIGVAVSVVKLSDSEGSVKSERKVSETTSTGSKNETGKLGEVTVVDAGSKDGGVLEVMGQSVGISDSSQQNPVTSVDVTAHKDNHGVTGSDKPEVEDHSGDEAGAALKFYTENTTDDDYDDDMESLEDFEVFHNERTVSDEKK